MFAVVCKSIPQCGITRVAAWNKHAVLGTLYKGREHDANVNFTREFHDVSGDVVSPSQIKGISHLRDPRLNKGLAFTLEERQVLGIHGLQPPRFKTQEEQATICLLALSKYHEDLNKYLYLVELQDRNEKLFFRLISENIEQLLPIVYTPTVGLACQKFGLIYRRPRGLFITIKDRGHVYEILKNWPETDVKCICVTDGERILGLGDLGACGMGIPVGKLALYTALAGIKPHTCLPITLDVGTNNSHLLEDPLYIGIREKRTSGTLYYDFVDEFMEACVRRYGQNVLIQFEDFGNHTAFKLLDKYKDKYCTFNDDIQGTASCAVAGIIASCRLTGKKSISENKFVFLGAGEAALGIAKLAVSAMEKEGLTKEQAYDRIYMFDIDGLLTVDREEGKLKGDAVFFAKKHAPTKNLLEIIKEIKPSILIGASAAAGAFTPEVLGTMAKLNERPVIFALSNPTSKAECTAQDAYKYTEGRVVFASGSPFGVVEYNGNMYKPGQGNNAYIFPGIALGVISTGIYHIKDEIFLMAAEEVAKMVSEEDFNIGSIYPPLSKIRECSVNIAMRLTQYAYDKGMATVYPEPKDKMEYIKSQLYSYFYESSLPTTWNWQQSSENFKVRPIGSEEFIKLV